MQFYIWEQIAPQEFKFILWEYWPIDKLAQVGQPTLWPCGWAQLELERNDSVAEVCRAGCAWGSNGLPHHAQVFLLQPEEMERQSLAQNTLGILDLFCLTPNVSFMAHLGKFLGYRNVWRVKCLLSKHEDQSLDLQNPHKCQVGRVPTCNSKGRDTGAS